MEYTCFQSALFGHGVCIIGCDVSLLQLQNYRGRCNRASYSALSHKLFVLAFRHYPTYPLFTVRGSESLKVTCLLVLETVWHEELKFNVVMIEYYGLPSKKKLISQYSH
jgi:hypothetical protein